MKIFIIGAGNLGLALALVLVRSDHNVLIANSRDPTSLEHVEATTNGRAKARVIVEGLDDKLDTIIFAIPVRSMPLLPKEKMLALKKDVIFVDASNYYPARDGAIEGLNKLPSILSNSQYIGQQLGRKTIKTFNSITAASIKRNPLDPIKRKRSVFPWREIFKNKRKKFSNY